MTDRVRRPVVRPRAARAILAAVVAILGVAPLAFSMMRPRLTMRERVDEAKYKWWTAFYRKKTAPVEKGPKMFSLGDRVKVKGPMVMSNKGRGYYNEGGGKDVPEFHRDMPVERQEDRERQNVVDGGTEGVVCGYVPKVYWHFSKPEHWKGQPRFFPLVSFDDPNLPIDAVDERNLELLDSTFSDKWREQRKVMKKIRLEGKDDPYKEFWHVHDGENQDKRVTRDHAFEPKKPRGGR